MHLNLSADEVLSTTRAVRKRLDFDRPVSREVIEECLQLALQAPTGSNSQGWQWVFVTDPAKKQALADIYATNFAEYAKFAQSNSYEEGDLRHEQRDRVTSSAMYLVEHFHRVPVMMVPCITGNLDRVPAFAGASQWGSILPAVWSFMLAARERGLGTAWTTIHLMNGGDKKAAEILGIPDGVTQAGLFPIAYTIGTDFKPAKRLPLDPITHWDQW
ncbi:MAG: nitroreductase family protein [Acidimicrobiaceae bacterium]|nr:nitroreductase family protein [Ilumatobacter sp.]MCB9381126.1 nitroreductase family protein [Acidimicrobiaceae bacterium]MCO5331612.1 nitroreductase family protein [Ilumatobacteraceae bacterium]